MEVARQSPLRELAHWPGAFSIVMATGILSIAGSDLALERLSAALLLAAAAVGVALAAVQGPALVRRMRAHAAAPGTAFGSLTVVAGTAVVGARVAGPGAGRYLAGLAALVLAFGLWLALVRAPAARLAGRSQPTQPEAASGEWCLAAVAPLSLAVLAAELAGRHGGAVLLPAAVALWAVGLLAYALASSALTARVLGRRLALAELAPDWWITMGALAIATVAADSIARAMPSAGLDGAAGEARDLARVTWWAATALIVPLTAAFALRFLRERAVGVPSRMWTAIFPLGMYALASHRLGGVAQDDLAHVFFWIALAAWLGAAIAVFTARRD